MPTIRLLLVVGLLLGGCATDPAGVPRPPSDAEAPDFSVQTFADGTFALSEQKGRIVVLNFFESW